MEIFKNRTDETLSRVFLKGYMGWEEIGELMPLDYEIREKMNNLM